MILARMQEIKEKSLIYEGLLYYFIVDFPQRAGALRQFLDEVLGPDDDITTFEYTKKNNKENGPGLVGIEIKKKDDYQTSFNACTNAASLLRKSIKTAHYSAC